MAQLRALADSDIRGLLVAADGLDMDGKKLLVAQALPELVMPYSTAAGELAGVMFEDLRAEAARRGVFYAETSTVVPSPARAAAVAGWATAGDAVTDAQIFSALSSAVGEWVVASSMDTIASNSARELIGYQRMPRPGACAFCQMLGSRSDLYGSEDAATRVVGVGSDHTGYDENGKRLVGGIGGGIKPRGKRQIGEKFHNDCYCVAVPVYWETEMGSLAASTQESLEKKYKAAVEAAGTRDTKKVLAAWRQLDSIR